MSKSSRGSGVRAPAGAVYVVVQNGSFPTVKAEIDRLFNGDAGFDVTTRDVEVGDVVAAAELDPRVLASALDNRLMAAPADALAVNAALRAEYGEWRHLPGGHYIGVPVLPDHPSFVPAGPPVVDEETGTVTVPVERTDWAAGIFGDDEPADMADEGDDDAG